MTGILIAICVAAAIVFSIARVVFGAAGAVLLAGIVGFCFGGPPAGGAGLVVGLVLVPITWVLGAMVKDSLD